MMNTLKTPLVWTILPLALLSAGFSRAQIEVELALDQTVYIVGEPIRADVSIVNRATLPFAIGSQAMSVEDKLTFDVLDNSRDMLLPIHPDIPMIREAVVPPAKSHAAAFELDEWYPITKTGRYIVTASVRRGDRRYDSPGRSFSVVPGLELKSALQLFADKPNDPRKLSLVYFMRREAEYLFLRVTDAPDDRTWTTLNLGRLLRTTAPTIAVSQDGEVTIIHRVTKDLFLKTRVRSTAKGVTLIGQDRIIDPDTAEEMRTQSAISDMDAKKDAAKKKSWWQSDSSDDAKK
jgi:hypothetical protein